MSDPNQTADLPDSFFDTWVKTFVSMGVNPLYPLQACMHESGCYSSAHNAASNAVGLIQFVPGTLADYSMQYPGTWQDFLKLSAEQQIPWVAKFFRPVARYITSGGLAYTRMFLSSEVAPAAKSGDPDYHLCEDKAHGGKLSWAYAAERPFDADNKGYITVADMDAMITRACVGPRWESLLDRMNAALQANPNVPLRVAGPSKDGDVVSNDLAIAGNASTIAGPAASPAKPMVIGASVGLFGYLVWGALSSPRKAKR